MAEIKEDFQQEFDNLNQHFKSLKIELRTKSNQLCEYNIHLGSIKNRQLNYLHEIYVLQSRDKPEVNKLHGKIKQLQEELVQLNENFNSEMLKHDEELEKLQDELRMRSADAITTSETLPATTDNISEENLMLEEELHILCNELCEKQLCLDQLEEQNKKLLESKASLCLELEHIKESTECKKQELVEAYDLINNLQETILTTKSESEALKGKSIKPNSDENSLFAEVNDRRLELQETLLSLSEKCNKMKLEVSKKQKHISTLRLHNEELTNVLKSDPLECQKDYKIMIDTYRSRISTLEDLSKTYQNLLLEKEELFSNGLPSNIMEFLNNVNEKNRKMEEELHKAVGMEFRTEKMMSIQLKEINVEIQQWKSKIDQLKNKLLEGEASIQKLKSQYNTPSVCSNISEQDSENSKEQFTSTNNEEKQKLVEECHKENSLQNADTGEMKQNEKRVMFTADTKTSSNHIVRRGAKVLQCKSVHIPSVLKKK